MSESIVSKRVTSETPDGVASSLGAMLGDIVWLMSQSPIHAKLSIADLEWLVMPPLLLGQFKIFRDENQPIGAVLWGYLNEQAEHHLKTNGRINSEDWGNGATFSPEKGMQATAGGTLWIVELLAPFHTEQNKHRELMLGDLMQSALKGHMFKLMRINPATNKPEEITLG